jgi:hypothetical protein
MAGASFNLAFAGMLLQVAKELAKQKEDYQQNRPHLARTKQEL